eukprot:TRINITY_DN5112_c0_g1_i9.p1 TRINITY_DN5112_c0_g1~~TRINITY_DN5112_c0_g1_i9.p1  ORF type:complete len:265 (-),score=59.75 TRINITY_DN5112_c0_g1_i9:11-691(-)
MGDDKRLPAYKNLIKDLNKSHDTKGLLATAKHLIKVEGEDTHGRTYITPDGISFLLDTVADSDEKSNPNPIELDDLVTLLKEITDVIREKEDDFPDALMKGLKNLATAHQEYSEDPDYKEHAKQAAFAMGSFNFEKGQCSAGFATKMDWFIETAEFYLDADMAGSASQQVKKAQRLVSELSDKVDLILRFKLCYARCADADRKFMDEIGRAVQQECRDRSRMPSSA